jgi:phosphate transport system substrate-binding protein
MAGGLATAIPGVALAQVVKVDPSIETYSKVGGVSGNLSSVGSDTLNNLMTLWAEGFRREYPSVRVQIEGKGSSTAPPALISATAQLGPMSRQMKGKEIDEFEKRFGYPPTPVRSLYGRNSASGTYGYFKKVALCKGDYLDSVKEQPGSASVVQGVTEDRYGMGYSGIGYRTSGVKALALAEKEGAEFGSTSPEDVYAGRYPLSRYLLLYVNKAPNKSLDPLVEQFLKFVLSRQGQEVVVKDGYLPVSQAIVAKEFAALE